MAQAKYVHLQAALVAFFAFACLLAGSVVYVLSLENHYVDALVPLLLRQGVMGSALQRAAFRQRDLLSVYGSSELLMEDTPNQALVFFRDYPSGFNVYLLEMDGDTSLTMLQRIASVGGDLRGKKVVISFTPTMFLKEFADPTYYAGNFSDLSANALVFCPELSYSLKARAARRMLQYPKTLDGSDPLLVFGLQNLADNSIYNRLAYYAVLPLGLLHNQVLSLQDHWEMLSYIRSHPELSPAVSRQPVDVRWANVLARSRTEEQQNTNTNPYGILNPVWLNGAQTSMPVGLAPGDKDSDFLYTLGTSHEWRDLDILLAALKEMGAQPLFVSRPFNGAIWDVYGVSQKARQTYYDKLEAAVSKYGFALVDFRSFDNDRLLTIDRSSHTSRLGWIYVNQVLDAFYHGAPLPYH